MIKKQHYVPKVYLKAWVTKVESSKNSQKHFDGVYYFENKNTVGEGRKIENILWNPHLYTVKFNSNKVKLFKKYPKIYNFFVNKIYTLMKGNEPIPVYGEWKGNELKTKDSIYKYLDNINNWDFYYYNGNEAKKKAFLNKFNDIYCYLLENEFSKRFENIWENVYQSFISGVEKNLYLNLSAKVSQEIIENMVSFFLMMLCRNLKFDGLGSYSWIADNLEQIKFSDDSIEEIKIDFWFQDLYRIFYGTNKGIYNKAFVNIVRDGKLVLVKANSKRKFITSDNPAFIHMSKVEMENKNGFYFPISPNYLLLIVKGGNNSLNIVEYRTADSDMVRKYNQIIASHGSKIIVSTEKERGKIL